MSDEEWKERLAKTHSIRDFQCNFIYHTLLKVLEKSSDGMTTSGFEKLDKGESYLFISNHRDILLDRRSVWIAQREGRTKDGNDATNPGVLKMVGMGSDEDNLMDYLKK
jgi:hypothetical protein